MGRPSGDVAECALRLAHGAHIWERRNGIQRERDRPNPELLSGLISVN